MLARARQKTLRFLQQAVAIRALARDVVHISAGERLKAGTRGRLHRLGPLQGGKQGEQMRLENGEEHILLAVEIIRHPVGGDAEALCQALDRGALIAEFGEEPAGGLADGGAFGLERRGATGEE